MYEKLPNLSRMHEKVHSGLEFEGPDFVARGLFVGMVPRSRCSGSRPCLATDPDPLGGYWVHTWIPLPSGTPPLGRDF